MTLLFSDIMKQKRERVDVLVVVAVIPVVHWFTLAPGNTLVQDTLSPVAVKVTSAAVPDDLRVTLNVVCKITYLI